MCASCGYPRSLPSMAGHGLALFLLCLVQPATCSLHSMFWMVLYQHLSWCIGVPCASRHKKGYRLRDWSTLYLTDSIETCTSDSADMLILSNHNPQRFAKLGPLRFTQDCLYDTLYGQIHSLLIYPEIYTKDRCTSIGVSTLSCRLYKQLQ